MKVFISHKREDSEKAHSIANRLKQLHRIDSYLDVIDPLIGTHDGPALAEHVQKQMDTCDSLLAVVSTATANSQWVPWEIGIATEKRFPLATYADTYMPLPEFLQKWPYLKSDSDLDKYAKQVNLMAGKNRSAVLAKSYSMESLNESMRTTTNDFYRNLKADLGR
jgi:hypothetical protein